MGSSWLLILWHVALSTTLALSTLVTVLIFTLPKPYDPYNIELIDEDDFTDDDKKNKTPGYGYFAKHRDTNKSLKPETSVVILVLGDIGRSPRMQYHATSIAAHGGKVDIVGYLESDVLDDIKHNGLINLVPLKPVPANLRTSSKALFPLIAPLKVLYQAWNIYYTLGYLVKPKRFMLVQNPPSIPTLIIAQIICFVRNTRLVIDWHNLGHTLLALKLGKKHVLVRLSEAYEKAVAGYAYGHFAVSKAMAKLLKERYSIEAQPVYDRPAKQFRPLSASERSAILHKLPETAKYASQIEKGQIKLVVSSTSWTSDEDFSLLLDALTVYSATVSMDKRYPKIFAIITGKGPLKEYYLKRIAKLDKEKRLSNAHVATAWLSMGDYAALLGAADLGVSLHTSSSGVDLPMKVVDMFGAGLPVVGWDQFEAWPELVKEGVNGSGFHSAEGLEQLFEELFGHHTSNLANIKRGALKESETRWEDEWPAAAKTFHIKVGSQPNAIS